MSTFEWTAVGILAYVILVIVGAVIEGNRPEGDSG